MKSLLFKFILPISRTIIAGALLALVFSATFNSPFVAAASVEGFNAGRIIDDAVFTNNNSMSPSQIQSFLSSKVPSCDTWGTQPSEFGGGTRAQWGTARGTPPPYTCIKDYTENGRSAAQIIYDIAGQFQINPQVLIVLLQKEQALITDTWPTSTQYRSATGYGCPDTAPCDSQYYGLTNQLTWAARMFRSILNASPGWYTPYIMGNNTIRWNPQASCGSSIVNIENRSTQALYNYTPYRPNQAALNAGYGMGDTCSAYGNRNFYLYFTDWFGSVRSNDSPNPHPDGSLVVVDNKVFLVDNGARHWVSNSSVFTSNSWSWSWLKPPTTGDRNLPVSWTISSIKPGTLFKTESSGIYISIFENGSFYKQQISYDAFMKLGYKWNQVKTYPESDIPLSTSNTILTDSSRHPDGTLVVVNNAVYMIDHSTLRHISPDVFTSNNWSWDNVIKGNAGDSSLPVGARMLLREGTPVRDQSGYYIINVPPSGYETKSPIGPWNCYEDVFKYSASEAQFIPTSNLPQTNGPRVTC